MVVAHGFLHGDVVNVPQGIPAVGNGAYKPRSLEFSAIAVLSRLCPGWHNSQHMVVAHGFLHGDVVNVPQGIPAVGNGAYKPRSLESKCLLPLYRQASVMDSINLWASAAPIVV